MKLLAAFIFTMGVIANQLAISPITLEGERSVYALPKIFYSAHLSRELDSELDGFIDKIYKREYVAPQDASLYYDNKTDSVKIRQEVIGSEVNKAHLKSLILDALSVGGGAINIPRCVVRPSLYSNQFMGATSLRASFTTYYDAQNQARASNIFLATSSLNGWVVLDGQSFSFNKVVGERTVKRGYKEAKVIKGDGFVDGVGGGVCQVSTTLYNAALLSGLAVNEVHRHTLAVSYVKKSFDAMVSYNFADLKLTNNTGAPILIVGWAQKGAVKFSIYGKVKTQKITLESVVEKTLEPQVNVVYTNDLSTGEERVVIEPKRGYESKGYIIIEENGSVTKRLLRTDTYKCVDALIERGA